jgi:hypothetical protein
MGVHRLSFTLAAIVEGYGDVDAVRVLVQRLAPEFIIARPVRQGRGKLVKREGLKHAVNIAAANITDAGAVLVLFDADDDCAKELGARLEQWLAQDFPHIFCRVVLAVREFEAWIVGGDPEYGVSDPDLTGNLEGRIKDRHGTYKKTVDQPGHISRSDLDRLHANSRSFRRLDAVINQFKEKAAIA